MRIAVSDLLFPGFQKFAMRALKPEYGIEYFYEFGKNYYWDKEIIAWGDRDLTIHGPCVAVDLANPADENYLQIFDQTFQYAKKCNAEFVVVHSNETTNGDIAELKALVIERFHKIIDLAKVYDVTVAIENVGIACKNNVLFTFEDFIKLPAEFPDAKFLIDTGHAHCNGWDLAETVKAVAPVLIGCHVHDNDGTADAHLPVGQGNIDWDSYFEAIKTYAPNAVQTMEYCCGFANVAELEAHLDELKAKYGI